MRTRTLQTRKEMTGSTPMTAAGDSTCSQLKQDTHILRLKFQIFSIKKTVRRRHALDLDIVPRQDSRDLGRLYASVQSTHTHTQTQSTLDRQPSRRN